MRSPPPGQCLSIAAHRQFLGGWTLAIINSCPVIINKARVEIGGENQHARRQSVGIVLGLRMWDMEYVIGNMEYEFRDTGVLVLKPDVWSLRSEVWVRPYRATAAVPIKEQSPSTLHSRLLWRCLLFAQALLANYSFLLCEFPSFPFPFGARREGRLQSYEIKFDHGEWYCLKYSHIFFSVFGSPILSQSGFLSTYDPYDPFGRNENITHAQFQVSKCPTAEIIEWKWVRIASPSFGF